MKIPEEYLQLTLRQLLSLHVPRRQPGPASVRQLTVALRRMHAQLRDNEAAALAEQSEWLADQFPGAPT